MHTIVSKAFALRSASHMITREEALQLARDVNVDARLITDILARNEADERAKQRRRTIDRQYERFDRKDTRAIAARYRAAYEGDYVEHSPKEQDWKRKRRALQRARMIERGYL
jgi:hypothetical protein